MLILEFYRELAEDYLAIPVITGLKSESEKFAGAEKTYTIEAMMGDKRALQAGTSHNLGQNFAKAFDVTFQTKENKEEYVWATSWGVSTRLIGAVVLTHGDEKGLRLPPKIAPIQLIIIPIIKSDNQVEQIKSYIEPIVTKLKQSGVRIFEDWTNNSPGFKFNEWEMKGVPLRMEIGYRDIDENKVVLVRRDSKEKQMVLKEDIVNNTLTILDDIQSKLFQEASDFRNANTYTVSSYREFKDKIKQGGFVRCGWNGDISSEERIKEDTSATIRCIPFDSNPKELKCIITNQKAKHEVIFAKAY